MKNQSLYPFIAPWVLLALISGIIGGLARIGWDIPAVNLAGMHGLIMVGGFLGTVISLEKTLPLKQKFWLLMPFLSGLSVLFMVVGNYPVALYLQLSASLGLVIVMFRWLSITKDHFYRLMVVGALSWMVAISGLIAGRAIPSIIPWWIGFILFIIVGERLELTRFLPSKRSARGTLYLLLLLYLAGIFIPFETAGKYLFGISLIGISVWLLYNDIVKISINKKGQHQYIAVLLLTGYFWLLVCGTIICVLKIEGYIYGAMVHSFFLGFAFSMIFAHGPVIVPGIIKRNVHLYSKSLYIWVAGFQISLIIRMLADFLTLDILRMGAGIGNALFILFFFGNILFNIQKASKKEIKRG